MSTRHQRRQLIAAAAIAGLSMSPAQADQLLSPTGLPEMRQLVESHPEVFAAENERLGILPGIGMMPVSSQGGPDVSELFAATAYTGTGVAQTITTGIDADLVWIKNRTTAYSHFLLDTARGVTNVLSTDSTAAQASIAQSLTAFSSTGFSVGTSSQVNQNTANLVAWSFAEAERFYTQKQYTGNGTTQDITHGLSSAPGMVVIKRLNSAGQWYVWHRGLTSGNYILLSSTNAQSSLSSVNFFGNNSSTVDPSDTSFTVGNANAVNFSGSTYIAYIFAHDTADDGIIQCGSYTGTGVNPNHIDLGWEAQFVLIKIINGTAIGWIMADAARSGAYLLAQSTAAETGTGTITFDATGFNINGTGAGINGAGGTYIYLAIRAP